MKHMIVITLMTVLLSGCLETLSQSNPYDFRKTRWGYPIERVLMTEQGKRIHVKTKDYIIYKHNFGRIQCKLVYCFKDNKLRTAGYFTDQPVYNDITIMQLSMAEHGEPSETLSDGMIWYGETTLIYANAYTTRIHLPADPEYRLGGGVLKTPKEQLGGMKHRWDGVWAYIDYNFLDEVESKRFPLDELTFYEKMLFGALKRTTTYEGTGQMLTPNVR